MIENDDLQLRREELGDIEKQIEHARDCQPVFIEKSLQLGIRIDLRRVVHLTAWIGESSDRGCRAPMNFAALRPVTRSGAPAPKRQETPRGVEEGVEPREDRGRQA